MCWEDVKIGRASYPQQTVTAQASGVVLLLPQNSTRLSVVFAPAFLTSNVRWLIGATPMSGSDYGIKFGAEPVILTLQQHGAIVTEPIWCYDDDQNQYFAFCSYLKDKPS